MSSTRMDICFADIYKDYLLFESCFEWRERRKWLRLLDGLGRGKGRARDGPEGKEKEARLLAGAVDYHSPPPPVPVLRTLGAARTPDTRSCRDGHPRPPVPLESVPPGKRRRVCNEPGCSKTFSDKPHLNRHRKSAHGMTFVGEWDQATAEQTAAYRRHLNEVRQAERRGHRVACPAVRSRRPERSQRHSPDLSASQRLPERPRVPLHVACLQQSLKDDERPFGKRPWGPYATATKISTSERFKRHREESVKMNKAARLREERGKATRERERYLKTPRLASTANWVVEEGIVIPRHLPTVARDEDRPRERYVKEISATVTTATVDTAAVPVIQRRIHRKATATTSSMITE